MDERGHEEVDCPFRLLGFFLLQLRRWSQMPLPSPGEEVVPDTTPSFSRFLTWVSRFPLSGDGS